jgi:hypothetical protein
VSDIPVTVIAFPVPTFSSLNVLEEVEQSIATFGSSPEMTPESVGAEQFRVAVVLPLNCLFTPRTPVTVRVFLVTTKVWVTAVAAL